MTRKKYLLYIMLSFWFLFSLLLILFLRLDSILWLFLGCLIFSFFIVLLFSRTNESFETIRPFPSLSFLSEEQVGALYCLFLESIPQGIFQDVLDQADMDAALKTVHTKLVAYFGKKHVCRISRNQFVVIKEFETGKAGSHEERTASLESISKHISQMLLPLIDSPNKAALQIAKIYLGSASSGIRYQARSVDDLIELAYFTMKIAQRDRQIYLVSDETIRMRKLNNEECKEGFLKKDWESEFTPFFQPIIESDTHKIIGMESLARWQLGGFRILEAKIFKDLAYEMALIERIDIVIIEKTLEIAEKLHMENLVPSKFRIVINICASTLRTLSAQNLVDMAVKHGLRKEDIELDIKDEVLFDTGFSKNLQEFKKRSLRVALDIFDKKAFNLESLFYNQYDIIKLDYSQYTDSKKSSSAYDTQLYSSLVSVASEHNVETLAKGIENRMQMATAKKHKVNYLQGNYFTPPIPFFIFQVFLKKYQDGLYVEEYNLA